MGKVIRWVGAAVLATVAVVATAGAAIPGVAGAIGLVGVSSAAFGLAASVALIGAQYLIGSNQSQAGSTLPNLTAAQSGPAPAPLYRTLKQAEVPRSFIFGRTRTGGAYFFLESDTVAVTGAAPTTSADSRIGKYLYGGVYICDGPIDGFDGFLCDDEAFTPGATGQNQVCYTTDGNANLYVPRDGIKYIREATYTTSGTGWAYNPYTNTWYPYPITGSATYATNQCASIAFEPVIATEEGYRSYILNTLMTSYRTDASAPNPMTGLWTPAHLGKGVTCLYTLATTTALPSGTSRIKYFPNGFPEWAVMVRGARMYDPRDPSQTLLHPATGKWSLYNPTWKWSENPAIIAGHFVSWLIDQGVTAITGVNWAEIADAATDCDALKPTTHAHFARGASFEVFARASGVFYFNTPPREFLANLMATCDGSYGLDRQGRFTMWIGKWEDPAVTFVEQDIGAFTEEFVESASEAMNEIHISYLEPRQNYQKWEAPLWQDLGSQALVGKRVASLNFQMIPSPNQAYRMAQRAARRINGKKKLTMTLGPRAMLAIKQRVVGVEAPNFGITGVWRVESLAPDMTLSRWRITLREIDLAVFADDPPPSDAISSLKVVNAGTLIAPAYFLLSTASASPGEGYVVVSADVNQTNPANPNSGLIEAALVQDQTTQFDARYSTDGANTWSPVAIELSANVLRTPDLASGLVVHVQTRWIGLDTTVSAWSAIKTIAIP